MSRVVHFEIGAEDPERAMEFYKNVFDWEFEKWSGPMEYWMVTTGPKEEPGINGGLMKRQEPISGGGSNAFVCTIDVSSVDEYIEKIKENDGEIIMGKTEVPELGLMAYCKDTEGNSFGIMEFTTPMEEGEEEEEIE